MQSAPSTVSPPWPQDKHSGFLSRLPFWVFVVALLAAILHIAPYWRAQSQVQPGWSFTGNLHVSPDFMQYRVWARQTQNTGILVDNKFTSEPNKPYLPVVCYYIVGQIAHWTKMSPEVVFAYAGSLFAFCLTILLFAILSILSDWSERIMGRSRHLTYVLAVNAREPHARSKSGPVADDASACRVNGA